MLKQFLKFSYGTWISAIISFFTIPITTFLINPEQFGKVALYSFAVNFLTQVVLVSDQSFLRFFFERPKDERSYLLWNSILPSFLIWLCLTMILFILWRPISNWLINEEQQLIVALLSINLLLGIFSRYAQSVVRMQKKASLYSAVQIISSIVSFVVLIGYSYLINRNFYAIIFANIIALLIVMIISVLNERKFWFTKVSFNLREIKELMKYGIPFLPVCLMSIFFEGTDKLFLREFVSFKELGIYTAAYRFVSIVLIIQGGFTIFWVPTSFEHYNKDPQNTSLYEQTFKYLSFILVIFVLIVIALKDLIILIFNKAYIESATIAPYLLMIPIMNILVYVTGIGINFTKKTYWHIVIFALTVAISSALNLILIPTLGIKGAALAMAIAYCSYFILTTIISLKLYKMNLNLLNISGSFIVLFFVAGINTFSPNKILGIAVAIVSLIVFILFNMSTFKGLLVYLQNNIVDYSKKNRVKNTFE